MVILLQSMVFFLPHRVRMDSTTDVVGAPIRATFPVEQWQKDSLDDLCWIIASNNRGNPVLKPV